MVKLSQRVLEVNESVTLKLNEMATALSEKGKKVYNLTAGQLPFKPMPEFIKDIETELNLLKSFQYSPIAGSLELRKKVMERMERSREISFKNTTGFSCVVSHGGKQAIYNALGALIDPGDEVVMIAPFWISYPEMVKLLNGKSVVVEGQKFNSYIPLISDIEKAFTKKTKAIIINSPNNPTGVHYPPQWMKEFAEMMQKYPQIMLISDEIYFDLVYFDPQPTYFYQFVPALLDRTIIVDGISKSFASTGLRIGFCLAPKEIADAVTKLQGQTTSGANSLIQRALVTFNFEKIKDFLAPIKIHLRNNSSELKKKLHEKRLEGCWYQTNSAFYFLFDFTKTPVFKRFVASNPGASDHADQICEELLTKYSVAMVPGSDFGAPNTGRISLVLEESIFAESLELIMSFLNDEELLQSP